jgi:hypothetical protein
VWDAKGPRMRAVKALATLGALALGRMIWVELRGQTHVFEAECITDEATRTDILFVLRRLRDAFDRRGIT